MSNDEKWRVSRANAMRDAAIATGDSRFVVAATSDPAAAYEGFWTAAPRRLLSWARGSNTATAAGGDNSSTAGDASGTAGIAASEIRTPGGQIAHNAALVDDLLAAATSASLTDGEAAARARERAAAEARVHKSASLSSPRLGGGQRLPHYSLVVDPVETVNPVTGHSLYYGMRPWRCSDRLEDLHDAVLLWSPSGAREAWRLFRRCAMSSFGEQPLDPYVALGRDRVMFFVDRMDHGMIRDCYFQKKAWSWADTQRVVNEDAMKMRTWRTQRELEMDAKRGKVDAAIHDSVWARTMDSIRKPASAVPAPRQPPVT